MAPGKANELELAIKTGGDDLRGDNDNLNVTVHFRDGRSQTARNVNGGRAWENNSTHTETITLDHTAAPSDIVEVDLQTTFSGGSAGDNWDLASVIVEAIGEDVSQVLVRGGPKRFTRDDKVLRLKRSQ